VPGGNNRKKTDDGESMGTALDSGCASHHRSDVPLSMIAPDVEDDVGNAAHADRWTIAYS
jgi:hypothetical protein